MESAKESLSALNPHVQIETINGVLDDPEVDQLVAEHHLVLDCTDNVAVREQLNRSCFRHKVPLVSAAASVWKG